MRDNLQAAAAPLGRVLLSAIFVMSGLGKIPQWDFYAGYMAGEGMVAVPFFLVAAMVFEIVGGLSVLLGVWPRVGAGLLVIFLIPTTLIFHDFWTYDDPMDRQNQMIHFMKNLAIMGGLLMVVALGSGCCSLGRRRTDRAAI